MKSPWMTVTALIGTGILAAACGGQGGGESSTTSSAGIVTSAEKSLAATSGVQAADSETSASTPLNTDSTGSPATANATVDVPPTSNPEIPGPYRQGSGRLENQILPAGARPVNEAAKLAPENFNQFDLLYANDAASDAFAFEVHKGFLATSPSSVTSGAQFDAYSPTTGETYRVTCEQGPKFTTCSTGTGATIYII